MLLGEAYSCTVRRPQKGLCSKCKSSLYFGFCIPVSDDCKDVCIVVELIQE